MYCIIIENHISITNTCMMNKREAESNDTCHKSLYVRRQTQCIHPCQKIAPMLEEKYSTNVRRKIQHQCQKKNIVPMLEEKYSTNVRRKILYQCQNKNIVPMLEEKYCTNVRIKILYQCQNKNIVPKLEEKYCTNVSFLCCPIMCLYVLSFVLWCPLQFPHFGSYSPPVVCRKAHVLFTLYVIVCVQCCPTHIVLCFLFLFVFVLCTICCQFLWIVLF